jgi:hypothetical protein
VAHHVGCIEPSCTRGHRRGGRDNIFEINWPDFAHLYLPEDVKDAFNEELFAKFFETRKWTCPDDCSGMRDNAGYILPLDIPGHPHVECPGCKKRFCAVCRVPFHLGMTCQEWLKDHPASKGTGKQKSSTLPHGDGENGKDVKTMAMLRARLCPRCQFVIVKGSGCKHMHCAACGLFFNWPRAEKVRAPSDTQGAVDDYIEKGVVDGPTEKGVVDVPTEKGAVDDYDSDDSDFEASWDSEDDIEDPDDDDGDFQPCELDA